MRSYILGLVGLVCSVALAAQAKWEPGLMVGGTGYLGDLTPGIWPEVKAIRPAMGAFVRYYFRPSLALRLLGWQGQLQGSDANFPANNPTRERGFSFENQLGAVDLTLEWDPWGGTRYPESKYLFRPRITPYFLLGFGFLRHHPKAHYNTLIDENANPLVLADVKASAPKWLPVIPLGGGLKFDLNKRSTLALEANLRYVGTDYLDGISVTANPQARDYFATATVHWSVRLGAKDSDGDGILDKLDACRLQVGVASARGCPDADGDGVEDGEDGCPEVPGLVLFSGCPDTDGDGFIDSKDQCPEDFGFEETGGCPDRDNDCLADQQDECPDLPGDIRFKGCPDSDGDNFPDPVDPCPNDAGLPEYGPCPPPDTDCDGLIDRYDRCPTIADTTTTCGCPDTDKDGLVDLDDRCPELAGTVERQGCPEIKKEDKLILVKAQREVRFQTGSAVLLPSSKKILNAIAEMMARYPFYQMTITGHTDAQGKDAANLLLSQRRAKACFDYLAAKKVLATRMQHQGRGETEPIADNRTAQGRLLNRRVEFELVLLELLEEKSQ